MMRFFFLVFFSICAFYSYAQFGNEWVKYNQSWFKIPVAKEGVYRITHGALQQAGFPLAGNPKNIQLLHRGVEQAIFIQGEDDGVFNNTDYIEFYGLGNDGSLDKELYVSPNAQPHNLYNLFSDTTVYFLTLGTTAGKRMTAISENPAASDVAFQWDERLLVMKDQYSSGRNYGDIQLSAFDDGEGWMGNQILQTQSIVYTIEGIKDRSEISGAPVLDVLMTGRGPMSHSVDILIGARLVANVSFTGFTSTISSHTIQWNDITADGKLPVQVRVNGIGGAPDRISVGYIKLRYPQQTRIGGASFKKIALASSASSRNLVLQDGSTSYRVWDVSDRNNVRRFVTTSANGLTAVLPSLNTERKVVLANAFETSTITPVRFRDIPNNTADFIIITHPQLRKPASGYTDPVKAYAEYRSLPVGGGYDTLVVNITQLYDQFAFGEVTPLAIYRFIDYLSAGKRPDYLFLIGKGLDVYYNYRRNPSSYPGFKDLVPTAGYPASDMLFSAVNNKPTISTGRLSAMHSHEVAAYLNKVKAREALPFNDLRRKNILHLSGGIYEGEPQKFRSYLEGFAGIARGPLYGANVSAIAKQSKDNGVIDVSEEVNKGVNLITFFGHSASTSTDFDIGNVTDPVMGYNNSDGKYPVMLMNGCYIGSYFLNTVGFSENWILTANRGAIAVVAHSYLAIDVALQRYSTLFYRVAFDDENFVNKGLGDVQKEIANRYLASYGTSEFAITQIQQMVLLGDPAIRLFGAEHPDFSIREGSVQLKANDDGRITALTDTLLLSFTIDNYGKALSRDLKITVTRAVNNQNQIAYDTVIPAVTYSGHVTFKIPSGNIEFQGQNSFTIKVDDGDEITELSESNNTFTLQYFIPLSGTQNLYPSDYAIVNSRTVYLTWQHSDVFSEKRNFLLEVDTVPDFNSSAFLQLQVDGQVLASKEVELLEEDSVTYYWRTRLTEPAPNESAEWTTSSFTYIEQGNPGWAQIHFPQLQQNASDVLVLDGNSRRMEFVETITPVSVKTFSTLFGYPKDSVSLKIQGVEYNLNLQEDNIFSCRNNTFNLVAFDRTTTQPYAGVFLNYLQIGQLGRMVICGRDPLVINSYQADEVVMSNAFDLIHYVDNVVAGDSVIMFSIGNAAFSQWPEAAKIKLGEFGVSVDQFNQLVDGEPVVIRARKGAPVGSAQVIVSVASGAQAKIEHAGTVTGRPKEALMQTRLIGPSQAWTKLHLRYNKEQFDSVNVNVIGVDTDGFEILLARNVSEDIDLDFINASDFPYLKLSFQSKDSVFVTSPQLKKWLITYEPVPEGVLLYDGTTEPASRNEGEYYDAQYRFVNISPYEFSGPTLPVEFAIRNLSTHVFTKNEIVINAPSPEDTVRFSVSYPTVQQDGLNSLDVVVNPETQPELYFHNNSIVLNNFLTVITDQSAPILDVTFDGKYIEKDGYVSPEPLISIKLWDDNPYLLTLDSTNVEIYLAFPCGEDDPRDCPFTRIYFKDGPLTWTPETNNDGLNVVYTPSLQQGTYTLRVTGRDANGNTTGDEPFEMRFKVKAESIAILSDPYPNPFAYKTNFDLILTGKETPDSFRLIIMTLSGRIVHEFNIDDAGPLSPGKNSISWNGIDETGNPLPPGLYVFRLQLSVAGKDYRQFGKIVLQR